ncbi:MAG: DNA/RNA non-specific endonuclease [Prevotella sp.]|nr:DNA/RNA non-specific endonuclease [Prevotella sp.]
MKQTYMSPVARVLQTIVLLFACINLNAQTIVQPANGPEDGAIHGMTIYLKDGTTKTYTAAELQDITYLPGIGMKVYLKNATTSVDYLYSQMEKVDYAYTNANANWKTFSKTDYPYANRLEYPKLNGNVSAKPDETKSQIIVKQTKDFGITYSVEWDNALIANRWTCYTLNADNSQGDSGRNNDFKPDEEAAVSPQPEDYNKSGYSQGHLCPSADRQCTIEQNQQTFFLTNMQPQWQKHNEGLWKNLEDLVRNYVVKANTTQSSCDTLYVVKAATITDKVTIGDEQVDGIYAAKCNNKLIVPKYFYMALLHYNKASNSYKAIAFWTLHQDAKDSNKKYGDYAISIDELEKRTGIDFFCNLPDEIEEVVEAECDLNFWKLTKTE